MKKPIFEKYEEGKEELLGSPGLWLYSCCDCHLQHIWFVEIIRGQKKNDDYIRLIPFSDNEGTKARRWIEKKS